MGLGPLLFKGGLLKNKGEGMKRAQCGKLQLKIRDRKIMKINFNVLIIIGHVC